MPDLQPGQIWWCQGTYLGFDLQLKTRPVLILKVEEDQVEVALLTSKRHLGSIEIQHRKGSSYLTGKIAQVPQEALLNYLDDWTGFADFISGSPAKQKGCGVLAAAVMILILVLFCIGSMIMEFR
jgi:hypothetical protein